jgi:nicotinate-nucleotide pyrophosphorylase (carboxylating)
MTPSPLPSILIEPVVRMALLEDRPSRRFDDRRNCPVDHRATTLLVARETGVVAGLDLARLIFQLIDPAIEMRLERNDGAALAPAT